MSSFQPPSKRPGIAGVYSQTNLYSLETNTLPNSFIYKDMSDAMIYSRKKRKLNSLISVKGWIKNLGFK
jgi:hypothetical protein